LILNDDAKKVFLKIKSWLISQNIENKYRFTDLESIIGVLRDNKEDILATKELHKKTKKSLPYMLERFLKLAGYLDKYTGHAWYSKTECAESVAVATQFEQAHIYPEEFEKMLEMMGKPPRKDIEYISK